MASIADFMRLVVAWPGADTPGWVNLHWMRPNKSGMWGLPFQTLPDFMQKVQGAIQNPGTYKEVYFCLSVQANTKTTDSGYVVAARHASDALMFNAIWIDTDYGPNKPYRTKQEAWAEVCRFRKAAGLPNWSAIVHSGGGFHTYLASKTPLPTAQWRPYAEGLKAAAVRHGLKCDVGVIINAAQVLRVPGTFNNKLPNQPRLVELLHLGEAYDFSDPALAQLTVRAAPPEDVTATVTQLHGGTTATFEIPEAFKTGPDAAFSGLAPERMSEPLDAPGVVKGCLHFKNSMRTHGAGQREPLWNQTALACTWLDNGRKIFHRLSDGYHAYDEAKTDKKFDDKLKARANNPSLGWPECKTFESEGAPCAQCPNYGKLNSPLRLAARVGAPATVIYQLDLPAGYALNPKGYICRKDPKGLQPLFLCQLRNFQLLSGTRLIQFETSLDGKNWGTVLLNEANDLINTVSINKALRRQGVKPYADKWIIPFMTSFMAKIDEAKERDSSASLGWIENDKKELIGFAYGGYAFTPSGKRRAGMDPSSDETLKHYMPNGSDEPWRKLFDIVVARRHPALECIVAAGFAAPLMELSDIPSTVLWAHSSDSGAHKSTSMALAAAIYGDPSRTKDRPGTSYKSRELRLGRIRNLPMLVDEINRKELADEIRNRLGDFTESTSAGKLTPGRTPYETYVWRTLMVVAANTPVIGDGHNAGTDAQVQRAFEIMVEKRTGNIKVSDVDKLVSQLDKNYGHIGLAYAELLGKDPERARAVVSNCRELFEAQVKSTTDNSEERFRCVTAAVLLAGAALAKELGCNFDLKRMLLFLRGEFLQQRESIGASAIIVGSAEHTETWIMEFIKQHPDNTRWISHMPGRGNPSPTFRIGPPIPTAHQRPIHILMATNEKIVNVSRKAFCDYLQIRKVEPSGVIRGLREHMNATTPKAKRNLSAGLGMAGGRESIICIPTPVGSPLYDALNEHTPPDERVTATETGTVVSISGELLDAATAQAKLDLDVVKKGTEDGI